MFKKSCNQTNKNQSLSKTRSALATSLQALLLITFAVTVTYAAISIIHVSSGVSKTIKAPEYLIRLQLVDASGVSGQAKEIAKMLAGLDDPELEIVVVDLNKFDIRKIERSVIISRERNKQASTLLADRLGLDSDNIAFKLLDNNVRQISTTLIVGEDFAGLTLTGEKKDNQK